MTSRRIRVPYPRLQPEFRRAGESPSPEAWSRLGGLLDRNFDELIVPEFDLDGFSNGTLVTRSAAQTISNDTPTYIAWTVETYDDLDAYDSGANTGLTIPVAGTYNVNTALQWVSNATGYRSFTVTKNSDIGSADFGFVLGQDLRMAVTGGETSQVISVTHRFDEGDILQVYVQQNRGGTLDIRFPATSTNLPNLHLTRLG